jgi:hypothetical protein
LDLLIEVTKATIARLEQLIDMIDKFKHEKSFDIDLLFPGIDDELRKRG